MASLLASTCWPTRFFAKWLAAFFAAALVGMILGALAHQRASPARVQVPLQAFEVYTDGTKALVPAHVTTAGVGERPVAESDQGATSTNPGKPLLISRMPGSTQWLIFQWQGVSLPRRINPWPQSSIPYIVVFDLKRPNPHLHSSQRGH